MPARGDTVTVTTMQRRVRRFAALTPGRRLRSLPRMGRRARGLIQCLALAVAVSLVEAPLSGPLHGLTGRCLSACPMHASHKLGCHNAAAKAQPLRTDGDADCSTAAISPRGCTCGHNLPTSSAPRAVLNTPVMACAIPVHLGSFSPLPQPAGRAADPPESPPPILCA